MKLITLDKVLKALRVEGPVVTVAEDIRLKALRAVQRMVEVGALSAAPLISRSGAELRYSSYDVLVIGGGIAGLTAAVGAANRWHVGLITKGDLDETATFLAQGGIAAAMGELRFPGAAPQGHS